MPADEDKIFFCSFIFVIIWQLRHLILISKEESSFKYNRSLCVSLFCRIDNVATVYKYVIEK